MMKSGLKMSFGKELLLKMLFVPVLIVIICVVVLHKRFPIFPKYGVENVNSIFVNSTFLFLVNATAGVRDFFNDDLSTNSSLNISLEADKERLSSYGPRVLGHSHKSNSVMHITASFMRKLRSSFQAQVKLMPAEMVDKRDRRPSFPFISGDGFRHMCKHRCERDGCSFSADQVESGACIYIATTDLKGFSTTTKYLHAFSDMVDTIRNPFVVITHNGDLSSPDGDDWHVHESSMWAEKFSHLLAKSNLIAWFASNCNWKSYPHVMKPKKLVCIPIGIENRYNKIGRFPEKYFSWMERRSYIVPKRKLLVAFTPNKIKPFREPALKALTATWITREKMNREGWKNAVQTHFFVVCPPGHGYDTHRVWEVLLAGSIPVVPSTPMDSMYENLPVLIVGNWSEVNELFLDNIYQHFSLRTDFCVDKLFLAYWERLILHECSRNESSFGFVGQGDK